jgi:hypothetical protein
MVRVGLAGPDVALDLVGDRGGRALPHRRILPRPSSVAEGPAHRADR